MKTWDRESVRGRRIPAESAPEEILPRSQRRDLEQHLKTAPKVPPLFLEPMKCKLVSEIPKSGDWVYELKIDGFRALAIKQGRKVSLISRNKKDLSARYPEILASLKSLPLRQ